KGRGKCSKGAVGAGKQCRDQANDEDDADEWREVAEGNLREDTIAGNIYAIKQELLFDCAVNNNICKLAALLHGIEVEQSAEQEKDKDHASLKEAKGEHVFL